jgi:hypothetical protein
MLVRMGEVQCRIMCGELKTFTRVSDEVHSVLGARQQHVDAVGGVQESSFPRLIAAHQRNDHHLGLLPYIRGKALKIQVQCPGYPRFSGPPSSIGRCIWFGLRGFCSIFTGVCIDS